jgi:hypothetical protein
MGFKFAGGSSSVDLPHQMIFRDRIAKTKLVDLGHSSDGPSWIDLTENRVTTTESRFASYLNDFCTKPARAEVDATNREHRPCREQIICDTANAGLQRSAPLPRIP